MRITYDPAKREQTLRERGLDFKDAAEVFAGKYTNDPDPRDYAGEQRFIAAGYLRGRMVVIVWTLRGDDRRIISMRYCHAKEEERFKASLEQGEQG